MLYVTFPLPPVALNSFGWISHLQIFVVLMQCRHCQTNLHLKMHYHMTTTTHTAKKLLDFLLLFSCCVECGENTILCLKIL